MTNEQTVTETPLTPEQFEAFLALNASAGEAASEETEIAITEDTADHPIN